MKRYVLTAIFAFSLAIIASAQVRVTGRVMALSPSSGGAGGGLKPVSDVIVKLVNGTKTLAFTSTNAKGEYSLEVKSAPSGERLRVGEQSSGMVTLQFTHISYEKESERLTLKQSGITNPLQRKLDMILTPKSISLKEVTVKPDTLRQKGDTLTHNLASFLGKGDVTLEDGLKRLPGVDVAQSGAISYMGKPISQFNIEGLDLLGGKYNLATRNIPADYVTNVEIVRNHHSRRVERDVPSNEVSMNIKLSKKAKLKPFGQEEIGIGVAPHSAPEGATIDQQQSNVSHSGDERGALRGLIGVTGMMFTDKFQTICSLKGGNYKGFARADMIDHFGGSDVTTPATSLFGGFDGGAPPQGEYLYQRNGMATLNGIHKLDSATTVKVNADYSYHRATHDISQSSTYLSGDGSYVTVSEQTSPLTKVHMPKLTMNYLKNADRVYLSETFVIKAAIERDQSDVHIGSDEREQARPKVKGKFEQNEGDVLANQQLVEQRRKTSSFEVGNDLFWMGRTEKGTRRHVNASVSFRRTPTLRLSFVNDGQGYGQTAQSSTLSMNVGSSFNIPIGKTFRLSLPVRVNAMYDDVETYRVATGEVNDIRGWSFTPSVNPGFEIHSRNRRFYLSAGLGVALKGLYYNRRNSESHPSSLEDGRVVTEEGKANKLNYTKPVLNPSMGINYTFSANSKLQFSTGYTTQIGDMMTLLTEPMQVDYRTVRTSSGIIGESNTWHTSGDWKWQLPMQYFTLSLAANHSEGKRNTLYSQSVSGIDISSSALQRDTRSRSTNFSVSSTKNFPSIFAKLGADATYGFGDSEQAISSSEGTADIIKIRSNNYNLHGNAAVTPVPWLELRYDIRYGWSRSRYSEESNTTTSLTHSGAIHVFPIATLDLSLDYIHDSHAWRQSPNPFFNARTDTQYPALALCTLGDRMYVLVVQPGYEQYIGKEVATIDGIPAKEQVAYVHSRTNLFDAQNLLP